MKKITLSFLSVFFVGILTLSAQTYMGLVGDATPIGYTPTGLAMEQDAENPNIFTYRGELKPGNFKIHLVAGDWCDGTWINAAVANQDLTATNYIVTTGCDGPDNQWVVSTYGSYSIVVDLDIQTITITELTYYANLYLVGDASPSGWDINNATPLIVDGDNPALFSWTGSLIAGEFKIATAKTFDGGWDWIHPLTQGQDLSLNTYEILSSGSGADNKWVVSNSNTYTITLDLQNSTITIQQGTLSIDKNKLPEVRLYPNPVSSILNVDTSGLGVNVTGYSVFDLNGRQILNGNFSINKTHIDLKSIQSKGVIFIKLYRDLESPLTFKVIKL